MKLEIKPGATLTNEHRTVLAQIKYRMAAFGYVRQGWTDEPGVFHWRVIITAVTVKADGRIKFQGWEKHTGQNDTDTSGYEWYLTSGTIGSDDDDNYAFEGVNHAPRVL